MNLNMTRPINETEGSLLSITQNCEMLFKKIHRKAEETLELMLNNSRDTFSFQPQFSVEPSWMLELTSLER